MRTLLLILLINGVVFFFEYLVPYTVQFPIGGLTNIENISVDSTYVKSANNKFNVIHK